MTIGVPFKKGNPGGGRPKGSPNKARFEVWKILEDNDCNPFEVLAKIATGKLKLPADQEKYLSVRLRMEAAAALAPYLAPKLKAIALSSDKDDPVSIVMNFGHANPVQRD